MCLLKVVLGFARQDFKALSELESFCSTCISLALACTLVRRSFELCFGVCDLVSGFNAMPVGLRIIFCRVPSIAFPGDRNALSRARLRDDFDPARRRTSLPIKFADQPSYLFHLLLHPAGVAH